MALQELKAIEDFLKAVDESFPVALSQKQDLKALALKFYEKATVCKIEQDRKILAMVAGYTENVVNNTAYISVVATLPEAYGKGYASSLVCEFIEICRQKRLKGVHLYCVPTNTAAMAMYKKLGFEKYFVPDEPRPNDAHFIYYITE